VDVNSICCNLILMYFLVIDPVDFFLWVYWSMVIGHGIDGDMERMGNEYGMDEV